MAVRPLVELRGLTKMYGDRLGVGPIDLDLQPGIHGLLGPNGSGKTTLIKTLLGFLTPTAGMGSVLGFDIVRDRLEIRRRIGYMAENDVLVPGLSATQTVRVAAQLCGMPAARAHEAAAEALHAVGMGDERHHAPQRLSTGQRQRMKLAAALVHAPRILFLDEPTNGLDPRGRSALLELIQEVAAEKDISVILSTHILPDVERVCRDAVVLRAGRVVAVEPVGGRAVHEAAGKTWYRVEVLGEVPAFLDACKEMRLQATADPTGIRVAAAGADQVMSAADRAGVLLSTAAPETQGVEDIVYRHMQEATA